MPRGAITLEIGVPLGLACAFVFVRIPSYKLLASATLGDAVIYHGRVIGNTHGRLIQVFITRKEVGLFGSMTRSSSLESAGRST